MNCGLFDLLTVDCSDHSFTAHIDLVCNCLHTATSHSVIILAGEHIGLTHSYHCILGWATNG